MVTYTPLKSPSPNELQAIIALYKKAGWWKDASDNPDLVSRIIQGSHFFLTATIEDKIIGMGRAISDGASDAYIQDVTVDETFRGRRIGSRIIQKLVDLLHADGLQWIGLIAENNSRSFYENLGFREMPNAAPMLNLIS